MSAPFAELGQFEIDPASVRLLGAPFCRKRMVVVLGRVEAGAATPVTVGMLRADDLELVHAVQMALARKIRPVELNDYEIERALQIGFGGVPDSDGADERESLRAPARLSSGPAPSVPALVNELLGYAVARGASDLHIECYEGDVDVRLRIDGELAQVSSPVSPKNIDEVISRLKVMAKLNLAERREAQDGRISAMVELGGESRAIDYRVSIVPGPYGEDAVLRVLDSKPLIGLDRLGFADDTLRAFRSLAQSSEGILLVTGPTGSGKTTTLYSTLAEIQSPSTKILTVEDPIEYHFAKINQKQVGPKMGFLDYARAFMRQDPDVMLIGEIRDEETADLAIRAAQTGHLVLSTLHTNSSTGSLSRLGVLGVDPRLVAETLLGALSQRLIRRLCAACASPAALSDEERAWLDRLEVAETPMVGRGCAACHGTGYRGRVGIYELFALSEAMAESIARGVSATEVRRVARSQGMRSLFDDALDKLRAGLTSLEELKARVPLRMVQERLEGRL